ncbi:hypothetical protein EDD16DRAFT_1738941 [Pisolithus croceorrhizus]|nr:hypothetical protein EDD16DRAFT_1738941 [Pisolithus croceorrhizus]
MLLYEVALVKVVRTILIQFILPVLWVVCVIYILHLLALQEPSSTDAGKQALSSNCNGYLTTVTHGYNCMPSYTKACSYLDKENFSGGQSCQPSEKLQQLTSEQQEQAQHCEIKAQKECKHLQSCQLAEVGSENDEPEGTAGNDQSGIKDNDDGDNGTQFTSCVVTMKLNGATNKHLMYSKKKVPKVPPTTMDINREITLSDNKDIEDPFRWRTQHWSWIAGKSLHVRVNYDIETLLLDASWAQACKVTRINLLHTPQLARLVTSHGSQVCSQLKTKFHLLVKAMFGFHSSQSKNTIKKNQALVEGLKEGTNFAFKVDFCYFLVIARPITCFLKALLIQKIVNTMWFTNKHDDRVMFHNYFELFPYPALVILPGICTRLYEVRWGLMDLRIHSGAGLVSAPTEITLSTYIIMAAIKEHEEGMTTKDGSD